MMQKGRGKLQAGLVDRVDADNVLQRLWFASPTTVPQTHLFTSMDSITAPLSMAGLPITLILASTRIIIIQMHRMRDPSGITTTLSVKLARMSTWVYTASIF